MPYDELASPSETPPASPIVSPVTSPHSGFEQDTGSPEPAHSRRLSDVKEERARRGSGLGIARSLTGYKGLSFRKKGERAARRIRREMTLRKSKLKEFGKEVGEHVLVPPQADSSRWALFVLVLAASIAASWKIWTWQFQEIKIPGSSMYYHFVAPLLTLSCLSATVASLRHNPSNDNHYLIFLSTMGALLFLQLINYSRSEVKVLEQQDDVPDDFLHTWVWPTLLMIVWVLGACIVGYVVWFRKAVGSRWTHGEELIFKGDQSDMSDVERSRHHKLSWGTDVEDNVLEQELRAEHFWHHSQDPIAERMDLKETLFYLASTKFASCFTPTMFASFYKSVAWKVLKTNDVLFDLGDPSDEGFFIIVSGTVGVFQMRNNTMMLTATLQKGDCIGELSTILSKTRFYKAVALDTNDCNLIQVSREFYKTLPSYLKISFIKTTLGKNYRLSQFTFRNFLDSRTKRVDTCYAVPHLYTLLTNDDIFNKICTAAAEHDTSIPSVGILPGEFLYEQGDSIEDRLYIVLTGRVSLKFIDSDNSVEVGPGAIFGGIEFVAGTSKIASVQAMQHTTVTWLMDAHFRPKEMVDAENEDASLSEDSFEPAGKAAVALAESEAVPAMVVSGACRQAGGRSQDESKEDQNDVDATLGKDQDQDQIVHLSSDDESALTETGRSSKAKKARVQDKCVSQTQDRPDLLRQLADRHGLEIVNTVVHAFSAQLEVMISCGVMREWKRAGEKIFSVGDVPTDMYLVMGGRVRVTLGDKPDVEAGGCSFLVGRGECLGEMAFLDENENTNHSSTAICTRDTELVKISRNCYGMLLQMFPALSQRFYAIMSTRLKRNLATMQASLTNSKRLPGQWATTIGRKKTQSSEFCLTIAVLPASMDVDGTHFAKRLTQALSRHGSVLCVNPSNLHEIIGVNSSSLSNFHYRTLVTHWLSSMEEKNSFIVFETESVLSSWTRLALNIADIVLLVVDGAGSPKVTPLEIKLRRYKSTTKHFFSTQLVLVHPDHTKLPKGTKEWFKGRRLDEYHHVKKNNFSHYLRLSRILAGKAVGVVLGGGGARGLSHLGFAKAAKEFVIPVDYVGGTSQGSFMAALIALQPVQTDDDLALLTARTTEMAKQLGSLWVLLSDATLPVLSYFQGKRFGEVICELLGGNDVQIEDLWIKFFCITTNITTADENVHTSGCLWRAVRASMTVIDYLPPMQIGDELLIDGGYVNNLPVDVLWDLYDPMLAIAVDVESKEVDKFKGIMEYGDHVSGFWLFWKRFYENINPFVTRTKLPRFGELVSSLLYITHNRNVRNLISSNSLDLYVRPDLGNTALLDYDKMDQIVDIGYRVSKLRFEEFRNRHHSVLPIKMQGSVRSVQTRLSRTASIATLDSRLEIQNEKLPERELIT